MSAAEDFSKVAAQVAWPITALLVVWIFYEPIYALLKRMSETLTLKTLKVKALGVEADLSPEYARTVLHELLDDITESSSNLSPEEVALFDLILAAEGAKTIGELVHGFVRDGQDHQRLRNLRDQKLIVPRERGQWKTEKHPVVTRYGHLVAKLRMSGASIRSFRQSDA
jgi:hypothetical protein